MSDRSAGRRASWWHGPLIVTLVVPVGVACAVGLLLSRILTPHWRMGGLTFVLGYPKSVELTAVVGGIAAGAASALLARWRGAYAIVGLAALAGGAAAAVAWQPLPIPWLPGLAVAALAAVGIDRALAAPRLLPPRRGDGLAALAWAGVFVALTFVLGVRSVIVDTFHDGSALLSGLDLVRGGRPFHSFIWAHGAHDAGLVAAWIALTGKIGTSPVALAAATVGALSVPTLALVARGLGASWYQAVTAAAAGAAAAVCLNHPPLGGTNGRVFALRSIGLLCFVALAFAAVMSRRRGRHLLAGAALAAAHLFRFELGVYGALAIGAVVSADTLLSTPRSLARTGLAAVAAMATGAGALLLASRLLLGWPDGAWFAHVFGFLPAYHSGYNGMPFPWPRGAGARWSRETIWGGGLLLFTTVLLAAALRAVAAARWPEPGRQPPLDRRRVALLVFVAVLAAAGLRTALDRSDPVHLAMWSFLPLYGGALLIASRSWGEGPATGRRRAAPLVALAAILGVETAASGSLRQLGEHLRPNQPLGPCGDTMLTDAEAAIAANWELIEDTCATEQILRAAGVEHLLITHSAAWYYARFRLALPSPHYMLNQAISPAAQLALVDTWRRLPLQAVLAARGYWALERYGVDDAIQVPVLEAYLRARRRDSRQVATPLGTLFLLDETADAAPRPESANAAEAAIAVTVDGGWLDPGTGFLLLSGWSIDRAAGTPAASVGLWRDGRPDGDATRVMALPRPGVAAAFGNPDLTACGWTLTTRLATPAPPADLRVHVAAADGRSTSRPVDPARITRLPRRSGGEWIDLGAAVDTAARLGAADRDAARQASQAHGAAAAPPARPLPSR